MSATMVRTALRAFLASRFFLPPGTRGFSFFAVLGPCEHVQEAEP